MAKDHSKTIKVLKSTINDLRRQVNKVSKQNEMTAKSKESSPEDHQAALDHFAKQYKMAKMNGQDDRANEYAKSYHDYASKLDKHYHKKLKEEVELVAELKKSGILSRYIKAARAQANDPSTSTRKALKRHRGLDIAMSKKYGDEMGLKNAKVPATEAADIGSMGYKEYKAHEIEQDYNRSANKIHPAHMATTTYRSKRVGQSMRYRGTSDLKPADEPHHVVINGKRWKTFGSKSHAENVAKKIKNATIEKA